MECANKEEVVGIRLVWSVYICSVPKFKKPNRTNKAIDDIFVSDGYSIFHSLPVAAKHMERQSKGQMVQTARIGSIQKAKMSGLDSLFLTHYGSDERAVQLTNLLNRYRFQNQITKCAILAPYQARVLEAGCGCGYVSAWLHELRPDLDLYSADIHPSSTWGLLPHLQLHVDDMTKSKFQSGMFDMVITFGVMEHAENDQAFMDEMYRILKPGGLNLMFNLPNKYAINDYIARLLHKGGHKVRYTKNRVKQMFESRGYKNVHVYREFLIPAQVSRISKSLASYFNNHYEKIDMLDLWLMKTPASFFSQTYTIEAYKGE